MQKYKILFVLTSFFNFFNDFILYIQILLSLFIKNNSIGTIQSCLIRELWISHTVVIIDFSHWIFQLRAVNPHWLSDILQQTRMNNYIVKGN